MCLEVSPWLQRKGLSQRRFFCFGSVLATLFDVFVGAEPGRKTSNGVITETPFRSSCPWLPFAARAPCPQKLQSSDGRCFMFYFVHNIRLACVLSVLHWAPVWDISRWLYIPTAGNEMKSRNRWVWNLASLRGSTSTCGPSKFTLLQTWSGVRAAPLESCGTTSGETMTPFTECLLRPCHQALSQRICAVCFFF